MLLTLSLTVFCISATIGSSLVEEQKCSSYDYDKRVLELLVRLELEVKDLKTELTSMKEMKEGLVTLEERVNKSEDEIRINDMKRTEELEAFKVNVTVDNQEMEDTLTTRLDEKIKDMNNKLVNSGNSGHRVSFLAVFPNYQAVEERPTFTKIIHNDENAYDNRKGQFTCKISGLYHFAYTFATKTDDFAYCWLYKNADRLAQATGMGRFNSGTISVYLYLDTGDVVFVKCSKSFWSDIVKSYTMWFTGALIRAVVSEE